MVFFLWNPIFYGRGSRFTGTTQMWIRFTLGSKQVTSPLVLLILLVELFPFNSETTFKLFALTVPEVILSCWKARRQRSSHSCCISDQKLFSLGCNARFISAGGLGWFCSLLNRWAEIAGVPPTLCLRVPPVFEACSLRRCSSSLRAVITNLV